LKRGWHTEALDLRGALEELKLWAASGEELFVWGVAKIELAHRFLKKGVSLVLAGIVTKTMHSL
jgi:hypothetical protein